MSGFVYVLLLFLLLCAIAVALTKDILSAVLIQLCFSSVMALLWLVLESPDLAITEAAVGAGVTGVLFFVSLRRLGIIGDRGAKKP